MCSHCRYDHDVQKDSYNVDPRGGTLASGAWFRDERGQDHQATACLRCGTVHATTGAPLKALFSFFSRPTSVEYYMTIEKLQELVEKIARDDFLDPAEALKKTALPGTVLGALEARGYLTFIEKKKSAQEPSSLEADVPSEQELYGLCAAFARVYLRFCVIFEKEPLAIASLEEFIEDSFKSDESSEPYQIVDAITYAIDRGYLKQEQLFEVISGAAQFTEDANLR